MNGAHDLLELVRAAGLPVTGFTIRDTGNVATWTFYGEGDDVTPAIAAQAAAIIQAAVTAAPAAATFWPTPDPLADRVARLERELDKGD